MLKKRLNLRNVVKKTVAILALTAVFASCDKKPNEVKPDDNGGNGGNGGGGGTPAEWTAAANSPFGSNTEINDITFGNGTFVAVGNGLHTFARSSDGINWTTVTSDAPSGQRIAYGNGTFVTVAYENASYSTDNGQTWTEVALPIRVDRIAYGNGIFVAVSLNGVITSTNGITWTVCYTGDLLADETYSHPGIMDIAFGDGKFVVVGGYAKVAYSTNGASWNTLSIGGLDTDEIECIAYGNGTFVVAQVYGKIAYSTNVTNWTTVTDVFDYPTTMFRIAFGGGAFVAGGVNGRIVRSTDNGKSWTPDKSALDMYNHIKAVAFGNNTFVAGTNKGKLAYTKVK